MTWGNQEEGIRIDPGRDFQHSLCGATGEHVSRGNAFRGGRELPRACRPPSRTKTLQLTPSSHCLPTGVAGQTATSVVGAIAARTNIKINVTAETSGEDGSETNRQEKGKLVALGLTRRLGAQAQAGPADPATALGTAGRPRTAFASRPPRTGQGGVQGKSLLHTDPRAHRAPRPPRGPLLPFADRAGGRLFVHRDHHDSDRRLRFPGDNQQRARRGRTQHGISQPRSDTKPNRGLPGGGGSVEEEKSDRTRGVSAESMEKTGLEARPQHRRPRGPCGQGR